MKILSFSRISYHVVKLQVGKKSFTIFFCKFIVNATVTRKRHIMGSSTSCTYNWKHGFNQTSVEIIFILLSTITHFSTKNMDSGYPNRTSDTVCIIIILTIHSSCLLYLKYAHLKEIL